MLYPISFGTWCFYFICLNIFSNFLFWFSWLIGCRVVCCSTSTYLDFRFLVSFHYGPERFLVWLLTCLNLLIFILLPNIWFICKIFHVHLTKLYILPLLRYLENCPPHSHLSRMVYQIWVLLHMAVTWSISVIFPNLIFKEYRT